jgi:histidyl-tRNA synthetase
MTKLRIVKGMHDILTDEMPKWHFVEQQYRTLVERFGYNEIRTPVLEPLELFVRGIGEATDIVEKEMYSFQDKGGANLALRPEGTASAIRAYIQHNIQAQQPQTKWFYIGPMFRRERPAKGRYRQFFQAGAELIGTESPVADAEIIEMTVQFIRDVGLKDVIVQLNSLGDADSRPKFRAALKDYFRDYLDALCVDCQRRIGTNPLRILDCKKATCAEISGGAPLVLDHLSDDAVQHFETVRRFLDRKNTPYRIVPSMVRGLDYYTRTIFEVQISSENLGAQTAILGGGRYDNLVKQLGGKDAPAIGFSFGIERLLMALGDEIKTDEKQLVYVAGVGNDGLDRAYDVAHDLRLDGYHVEISYAATSLRSQLKRADRLKAHIAVIAGEDEASRGSVTLRNMKNGAQQEALLENLKEAIEAIS